MWGDDVGDRVDGEKKPDATDVEALQQDILASEPRQAFVPDGRQELLDVWVGAELMEKKKEKIFKLISPLGTTYKKN